MKSKKKSKKSRIYGIVGLALLVSAVLLAFKPEGKGEFNKPQTKIEQVTKEARIAKAKVRQRPTPQPVEVTLGGFKSSWDNEK